MQSSLSCKRRRFPHRGVLYVAIALLLTAAPRAAWAQPTLRQGNKGPEVRFLQRLLNEKLRPNPNLALDGQFGPRTNTAVRAFQGQARIGVDGVVGAKTWSKLLLWGGGMSWPLRNRPSLDYHIGGRYFGAPRDGGSRAHAGCDLIAPSGTQVLAVANGTVTAGPYYFYEGTYALEVRHDTGFTARYGEIRGTVPAGIRVGARVTRGQVIAYVGRLNSGSSMLHFEMFKGTASGSLTQGGNRTYDFVPNRPYSRRRDVINPTYYLDRWPLPR